MNKKDVFISYKAEEFDDANWVRTVLEKNGISCWMAPTSISGGSSYASEIPQAIRNCKVFVLILSEKAQLSKWVPRELDQAINENKVILPFMIENCSLKDDFNFYLSNVQRYSAYENKSRAMEKMVKEIKSILGIKDVSLTKKDDNKQINPINEKIVEKKVAKKPTKKKHNKKLLIGITSALLIVCSVVAIVVIDPFGNSQIVPQTSSMIVSNSVTIADEKFMKNSSMVSLRDKSLTEEDINKFKSFKDLRSVSFYNCTFPTDDLSVIINSTISYLTFENCNITNEMLQTVDFSSINLSSLYLNDNKKITDLSVIADLSDTITSLYIDNTGITDISVLKDFSKLRSFSANGNGITDITALSNCIDLYNLSLDGNKISSLKPIEKCKDLTYVNVANNQLKSLEGLEKAISLAEINANNNQLTSLKGIDNTTVLTKVSFSDNLLEDISLLEKSCVTLREVYLHNNKLKDISSLSNSENIESISLDNNQLTSIDALSKNTCLSRISASNNKIKSIDSLSEKSDLIYIDLSNNVIETTGRFAEGRLNGSQSAILNLSNNKLKELKVPNNEYANLFINGNEIKDLTPINELTTQTLIFDYISEVDYSNINFSNASLYIMGCPLDKQLSVDDAISSNVVRFIEESEVPKLNPFYKNLTF